MCLVVATGEGDDYKQVFSRCKQLPDEIKQVLFDSYPADCDSYNYLPAPGNALTTPFSSLLPYHLWITKKGDDGYQAIMSPAKDLSGSC